MKTSLSASYGIRLCGLLFCLALLACGRATAQASSDACGTNAANQYPVGNTCVPLPFNKPATYVFNYNPGGCNAGNFDDAYGWFKATSTTTTVRYTPQAGTNAVLHVLAACGGAVLGCADGLGNGGTETVTIPTVIGTNYIVRVQRKNDNSAMNGTLCIYNSCVYTLTLYDSYGDGWVDGFGQAYVEIIVDGVSLGLWSMNNGFSGTVSFGVTDGQTVEIIYYDGGSLFYDENSFELSVGGDCLFSTYTPPNIQVPYTTIADCTPSAAALPQDCIGGATICGNASIYDNNATTGCVMDLNDSNSGCLLNYDAKDRGIISRPPPVAPWALPLCRTALPTITISRCGVPMPPLNAPIPNRYAAVILMGGSTTAPPPAWATGPPTFLKAPLNHQPPTTAG